MNIPVLDQPSDVRPGEELELGGLSALLNTLLPAEVGPLTVRQFPGGASNLTYLLRWGQRELVLRRPPFGANIKGGHDMGREYRILRALAPVYPQVPQALAYCADEQVIGAPFYLMERVPGVILRAPGGESCGEGAAEEAGRDAGQAEKNRGGDEPGGRTVADL